MPCLLRISRAWVWQLRYCGIVQYWIGKDGKVQKKRIMTPIETVTRLLEIRSIKRFGDIFKIPRIYKSKFCRETGIRKKRLNGIIKKPISIKYEELVIFSRYFNVSIGCLLRLLNKEPGMGLKGDFDLTRELDDLFY